MLSLNDPLWASLKHAYGSASDIPAQLKLLMAKKPLPKKYWEDIWGSLCHQYEADTASYAALPHLVAAGKKLKGKDRFNAMFLASGIVACSSNGKRPKMPPKLAKSFKQAVQDGRQVLAEMVLETRKKLDETIHFLAMIAAFEGQSQLTGCLWTLSTGFDCPKCEHSFAEPISELSSLYDAG
jgi:hypothetical protein